MGWVLFFDGDCAFCSNSVRQVIKFDKRRRIRFAPLQGKLAHEKGFTKYADKRGGTMVILRESDGKLFMYSDGWIEVARALGGWWKLLTVTAYIPRWIRNGFYRWFAAHRYWFAKGMDFCSMPDPEIQRRLVE